ncbi:phosphopantetheine adenylyltransferase [Halosimplex carlsbadense 2-9-1]|uniref:Phosphopantetheine adenylyltransferase n=1 Tax=Halosimplex carlsbadense 2-9-1 TaxID=797114 RepID=M0CX77_9EURY|nr:pantetheine-phosphate adenylyltransferase [Halosimplex carlsbadense]ELZ27841.1 phosphopantetheine adenylyltransferase [Halosimplex carlsbadense 2-9-1]
MRVAVAGTFGPIHDGHRALFRKALERGEEGVLVALTTDEFARGKRERPVPDFTDRRERLREEIDALDEWDRDVEIRELHDEHGIASTEPALDALVVSPETAHEIADINAERVRRNLAPMEGFVVPFVRADDGERISSTRLVAGEIDEHGELSAGEQSPTDEASGDGSGDDAMDA